MHRHLSARRGISIGAATLLLSAATLVGVLAVGQSAGALTTTHVSDGAAFKVAFANDDIVVLDANIHLGAAPDDCTAEPLRNSANPVVVDGQGQFAIDQTCADQRVLHNQGAGTLTVQGVTALSGGEISQSAADLFGGGIWSETGPVVVTNSVVTGNSLNNTNPLPSNASGGGIAAPTLTVTNSSITANHLVAISANGGGASVEGDLTVTASQITNNTVDGGTFAVGGGAVFGGTGNVVGSTISGNFARTTPSQGNNTVAVGGGLSGVFASVTSAAGTPGSIALVNSSVGNNTARADGGPFMGVVFGGGIFATEVDASNTAIDGNNTQAVGNTAQVLGGGVVAETIGTFTTSSVSFNTADAHGVGSSQVLGGGISVFDSEIHLVDSRVDGNLATAESDTSSSVVLGGGVFTQELTMTRSSLSGNRASAQDNVLGGGAYTQVVAIDQSQLVGDQISASANLSEAIGGALLTGGGTITASTIATSRVMGPNTVQGGGIVLFGGGGVASVDVNGFEAPHFSPSDFRAAAPAPTTPLTLVNSTLANNSAEGTGDRVGGAIAEVPGASLILVYVSMFQNGAATGANIGKSGGFGPLGAAAPLPATLSSFGSVVAGPLGGGANCAGLTTTSNGYNYSTDASCGFTAATDAQSAADPQLAALGQNGGPTPTLLPADTSPLVDAIPVSACQADGAAGVTIDQRGVNRPQITGCDIGAVEVLAAEVVAIAPRFTG